MTKRKETEQHTNFRFALTLYFNPELNEKLQKKKKLKEEKQKSELFTQANALVYSPDFEKNLEKVREKIKDRVKDIGKILNQALSEIDSKNPVKEIYSHIQKGNLSELKESNPFDIDTKDYPRGISPFGWACAAKQLEIVRYLLDNLVSFSVKDVEMVIGSDDPVILGTVLKGMPDIFTVLDGEGKEADAYLCFILSYGATRNLEFLIKRALLSHNTNLLLQYLVFLDFLEEFSVSSLLIPYQEEATTILSIWNGDMHYFLLNFVIPWGSLKFFERIMKMYSDQDQQEPEFIQSIPNMLTKAIKYNRDLNFIRGIAERYPAYIFNKKKDDEADTDDEEDEEDDEDDEDHENHENHEKDMYPMAAAIGIGRLDVVQYLKNVAHKRFEVESDDECQHLFHDRFIIQLAAEFGHAHFFAYFKKNVTEFQKYVATAIPILNNLGAGQYRILQDFHDIKQWKNAKKQNFLHLASSKEKKLDVETVDWLTHKNPAFWWSRDNDNRTPLDLAFLNKSKEMLFYALASNRIPLDSNPALAKGFRTIQKEFNESLPDFLAQYFAIRYSPRYGTLGLDLIGHISEYLAKGSAEKAILIGIELDSSYPLFQKAIPLIYPEYQTRTELKPSSIEEWRKIAEQEERHAAAQIEAKGMVQLVTKELEPSQQKQLEKHIPKEEAALYTAYSKSNTWPSKKESLWNVQWMAWRWRQRLKDSATSSSSLTIGSPGR
jgi:hypothetical protein